MSESPDASAAGEPVGRALRAMRKQAGLTGLQLGQLVEMSQSKISRLESGRGLPDPDDVGKLARALGAEDDVVRRLMDRAETSHNRMTDWRPTPTGLPRKQESVGGMEDSTRQLRVFQPAVVVGLLQTSEYARAVLSTFQHLLAPDEAGASPVSIAEAVSGRVHRQEILADPARTFDFVMTETVFRNRVCPPDVMINQLGRIRTVARQPNVSVRVVPSDAALEMAPYHGFELMDDRMVLVDLFNTGLTSRGPLDLRVYRKVFDGFASRSVADIDPILERYQRLYAGELVSSVGG